MVASALRPTGMRLGANCRSGLPGEEFRALREYRSGDNPRYIHWRASAHLGSLHVRQMERERSAPVLILLDSRLPDPRDVSARESLEKAISFAAEVCREALKQGNSVKLVAFFPEARLISGATGETGGGPQLRLFLDALARLEPSSEPSAERLVAVADEAGFDSSWKAIAVTPIGETAGSLRAALAGHNVELHVVSEPGFDRLFRLVTEGGL